MAVPPTPTPFARLLVLAFLAGAALMTAELAAPRLVAPHLGAGLLTWSAIFAVFLGGLALGNLVGGRLADRGGKRTLPRVFAYGALALWAAWPIDDWFRGGALAALPHGTRALVAVLCVFGPGAFAIGTIAPVLARAALGAPGRTPGRALGQVAAATAVGSVFGTFITGFLLIPDVRIHRIYLGALVVLAGCVPMAATIVHRPRHAWGTPPPPPPRGWAALAALAGGALLVVEVIAARVAATRLGTSVYTWTSVVGVVLLALSAGNALGGALADRYPPRRLLGLLLTAASVAVASCLWTPALMRYVTAWDLPWMLRTLTAVAAAFFVPAMAIGTLTPVIVRGALTAPESDGRTVGRLYAIGTAGAVAGSVLAGYVLIPLCHVPLLIALLALALALSARAMGQTALVPWIGTLIAVAALARGPWEPVREMGLRVGIREDASGVHVEDSRYFHIAIEPHDVRWVRLPEPMELRYLATDPVLKGQLSFARHPRRMFWRGPMSAAQREHLVENVQELPNREAARRLYERTTHDMRVLSLDRFGHGFVDLADPLWLEYEYEILTAALVRALWPAAPQADAPTADAAVRCFFIGGGAYSFQRRLLHLYGDGVRIVSAEIDPAVTRAAGRHLGLTADARHEIVHDDARTVLRTQPTERRFDFVFGDAFHDLGVPWHLTTQEFAREVKARMTPEGVYLVNMIDMFASGRFLNALRTTLATVFAHVRVLSMGARDDHAQETFLLVASDRELTWGDLVDDEGLPLAAVAYDDAVLDGLARRTDVHLLEDDLAPVEHLLAPVVRLRGPDGGR